MIHKYVLPAFSVWVIALHLHLLHLLHMSRTLTSPLILVLLFSPVVFLEIQFSRFFHRKKFRELLDPRSLHFWYLACRLLFWLILFLIWSMYVPLKSETAQWLKWFGPKFYLFFALIMRGEGWLSLVAILLWGSLYWFFTVRRRAFRFLTGIVLPIVFILGLFTHLYFFGGRGNLPFRSIEDQCGVRILIDLEKDLKEEGITPHPRFIYFLREEEALVVSYGCTFCSDYETYPTVLKIDLSGEISSLFRSGNVRKISVDERRDAVFVAPWYTEDFYELSLADLSPKRIYSNQAKGVLQYWEPMVIAKDHLRPRLYVANDVEQAILAYDLETGELEQVLQLGDLVQYGGPVWNLIQSKKTGRLYFTSGPGENLFEADAAMLKITKHRKFPDITGTALALDDDNDLLYYQSGWLNIIYEVDIASFQIKRRISGEGHARCILLDEDRNCIYVLGYFSGTLFPVDLKTGRRRWTVNVGGSPHGMALDKNRLWVNSMRGVIELDLNELWSMESGDKTKKSPLP